MHVAEAHAHGNSNIGLYAFATNSYCVLGPDAADLKELLEEVLKVPVIVTTVAGTSLAGVFLTGTSTKLLAPSILFDHEREKLAATQAEIHTLDTTHTALGNNIVTNDHGALAGPMYSNEELEAIQQALDIDVNQFQIADIEVVGSSIVANNIGGLIHKDASKFEQDMAIDTLRLKKMLAGTVNFGTPYVRSGIIANDNGFLIGSSSGGPEITNADEALGFIDA